MKIKCIAVDDEPLALRVIESHIEKLNDVELVAKCSNAIEAFGILKQKDVDLIFLDIQMPELTGIEFLKSLSNPPLVIFTTAYRNYAIDAFDLDVLDYLLKPISFDRFLKAINKYYTRFEEKHQEVKNLTVGSSPEKDHLFIKKNKTLVKVFFKDILFIESLKDYVKIHTTGEVHMVKYQISHLEKELPEDQFIRVHKSFIVSSKKIATISPRSIGVEDEKIPIGRNYKEFVLKKLNYYGN
ncbi:MAG: DNA-binding response regulator [Bacteroidetes bacterium 4484_276]|nr:MAG: DNA-binding response regulator [Bacteroidetes bacterium 4484_276]OYT12739.1 MAG: DNA-binding response regulator [Bacteroidetes bacterium 4572_114]